MSATGKSTVIRELRRRGYKAVDADEPGWSEYRTMPRGDGPEPEWVWREDRIEELLQSEDADVLFLSGCASNQGQFYPRFDYIVLLSAPPELMLERLATRSTNDFGKRPEELARIMADREAIEPLLRRRARLEVDTRAPLPQVVAAVLSLLDEAAAAGRP
jgi:shikimate kinase